MSNDLYPEPERHWIKVNGKMTTVMSGNLPVAHGYNFDSDRHITGLGLINLPFVYWMGMKHVASEHELFYVHPEMLRSINEEMGW